MRSSTETLIAAMEILSREIESGDGVANAAIAEAGQRLKEQAAEIERLKAPWGTEEQAMALDAYDKGTGVYSPVLDALNAALAVRMGGQANAE